MPDINLLDRYPQSGRPIDERAALITEQHRQVARQFGKDFFDGDRLSGYGGYSYHPRFWTETVQRFRDHYALEPTARILDVGCAKGFMLHDFKLLLPDAEVVGLDISEYAIRNAHPEVASSVFVGTANALPFSDDSFDLVISINTIHNLPSDGCKSALQEIQRVSRAHSFVTMDAWRSEAERQSMLKWNLTALTYMHVDDWHRVFAEVGYTGDSWWFIAE